MFGKNQIGIIQGRLTASDGKLQCFPYGKWKEEFFIARSLGFDCIELIVERKVGAPNPLWETDGVRELLAVSKESGVRAFSLCDDQIMDAGLLSAEGPGAAVCFETLVKLLGQLKQLGATRLILPFLEEASVKENREGFLAVRGYLEKLVPIAEDCGVEIMLENDLPTPLLKELVSTTAGKIGVCYDTGNRTWFGFTPGEEILELGSLVRHVHIKDKAADGKNVMLGTGAVDFASVFSALRKIKYDGPLILETSRGDEDVQAGRENIAFVRRFLG
ncbi:MAG: sugar phosphate isomerase/epimerase family protein [Patescibacteria group bacterium]